jgi:hypothetical protein
MSELNQTNRKDTAAKIFAVISLASVIATLALAFMHVSIPVLNTEDTSEARNQVTALFSISLSLTLVSSAVVFASNRNIAKGSQANLNPVLKQKRKTSMIAGFVTVISIALLVALISIQKLQDVAFMGSTTEPQLTQYFLSVSIWFVLALVSVPQSLIALRGNRAGSSTSAN